MATKKSSPSKKKSVKKAKKKAVKKKVSKKKVMSKVRKNAAPDRVFVLVNGKRVKNVKELADVMDKIEDYVFNHHVTEDRNDFCAVVT